MASKPLGQLLVLCAPSGAGKSTLVRRLRAEFPQIRFSISCTTRAPRPGEQDGVDYHFLTRDDFLARREALFFAEWAEVHGNLYGTPRQAVVDVLAAGHDLLFDIDVQGARQLRRGFDCGGYVFILPPSRQALVDRLHQRGTDSQEVVARRLANAAGEIAAAPEFDYLLVNDDLDTAYATLRAIYLAARQRPDRHPGLVDELLAQFAPAQG